jgi:DNA-binding beta-propeller fold protein YncE
MKANVLPSLFCLLSVSFAPGFSARPAWAGAAAGQASAPPQANAPGDSKIGVESWAKPQPGWLYVLDPKPDAGGPGGRVWLVDPETGKVMGSIRTGDNADFALSPDGSRLYVASITEGDTSEFAVIDTAQGTVLQRGAIGDREVADVLPAFSTMAVSGDGLVLRILIDAPKSADADSFLLAAFDTQTGDFLTKSVHLGNCGPGRFISYPTADQFDFLCPRTNRVRLIRVDAESRELQNLDVILPWERRVGVAEAIEAPGDPDIAIVRGDGTVTKMNVATHEFADTAWHPDVPNRIPPAAWPTSPDGGRVFLGYNNGYDRRYDNRFYLDYGRPPNLRPNDALAYGFRVLDTRTWRKIGTIKTSMPFWSAVTGNDGKMLYAMAPQRHSILVIDTGKMRQIRVLKVGGAPALALVAP